MTTRLPLFDFMPYGAPELHAGSRGRMLRAQVAAVMFVALMFATAWLAIPRLPEPARPRETVITLGPIPPLAVPRAPRTKPSAVPKAKAADHGRLVPVDRDVETDQEIKSFTGSSDPDGQTGSDEGVITEPGPTAGNGIVEERLPGRDEYVWADEYPVAITMIEPRYSDLAVMAQAEGRVVVHMLVGKDGRVVRAEVDEKIHVPLLDESALEASRRWVFKPAFAGKHPVAVWVSVPFVFRLR